MADNPKIIEGAATQGANHVLVLNCTDIPLHHWLLCIGGLEIRMNVNQFGVKPVYLIRDHIFFAGVEQGVFVIDLRTRTVKNSTTDISNVQWIDDGAVDAVVIAAEDDILVFDNFGSLLWRSNLPDIIQSTNIIGNRLYVSDMAGNEYDFKLCDGSRGSINHV